MPGESKQRQHPRLYLLDLISCDLQACLCCSRAGESTLDGQQAGSGLARCVEVLLG